MDLLVVVNIILYQAIEMFVIGRYTVVSNQRHWPLHSKSECSMF